MRHERSWQRQAFNGCFQSYPSIQPVLAHHSIRAYADLWQVSLPAPPFDKAAEFGPGQKSRIKGVIMGGLNKRYRPDSANQLIMMI